MNKIDVNKAKQLIIEKLGSGYMTSLQKENRDVFIFVSRSLDKEVVPSGFIVAVNKSTGRLGVSITSEAQAIDKALQV